MDQRFDPSQHRWAGYAIAVGAVLAATLVRVPLEAAGLLKGAPFLLYFIAILAGAWFGGFGPGVVATALGTLLAVFFYMEPQYSLWIRYLHDGVAISLFMLQGMLISLLGAARLRNARQLAESIRELESRVAQRTLQLQTANADLVRQAEERDRDRESLRLINARLEQSNRELQDFASVASHDLQEPLRKIRAFGDRLQQRAGDTLSADHRDYLARMLAAAERMQVLISDLLTFSRVTTKAQPLVPVDLGTVTDDVISDLEARVEESGGKLERGDLPTVLADPTQMRQLLQNLAGNALKFARPGVPPHVRITAEEDQIEHGHGVEPVVRILVSDNGIGFDEKYLDRIFNVFQRLHGRQDYEGTGIGLAVCRKIARRHGGDITARSKPGEGATFIVTLPMRHEDGAGARDATGVFAAIAG